MNVFTKRQENLFSILMIGSKRESTQIPISSRKDRYILVYLCNGILHSNDNEPVATI